MKKILTGLLLSLLLVCAASLALAAEAVDITDECKFKVAYTGRKYTQMTDKKYTSYWESKSVKNPFIAMSAPDGKTIAFVVRQASLEKNAYPGDLWLLDVETKALRQLTFGGDATSFFWTKQGTLMFPAKRDPELKKNGELTAWYEISPNGGEAHLALTLPFRVKKLTSVDEDRYIVSAVYQNQDADSTALTSADCSVLMETPFWTNGIGSFTAGRRTRL